jgi:hypothetical protein
LRLLSSNFRANAAPWSFRTSLKYRGIEGDLLSGSKYGGNSQDFEISHCEFTDSHDGIWLGNVRDVKFHHNPASEHDNAYHRAYGRIAADHGSPMWEPMFVYHNTIITQVAPFQNWYAAGLASHMGNTTRAV